MSDKTANLSLPFILPSQAQKHVTHNEALQLLDGLTQLVIKQTLTTPPASPADGEVYRIGASATALWTGKDGKLALFFDGQWTYLTPKTGWMAWFIEANAELAFDGTNWINAAQANSPTMLGINATADTSNRLALSSPASLFNHEGAGHQIKLNKATTADTISLLFQTNWSGRAEIGLAGSDRLQFKTSADGAIWKNALEIDGSGVLRRPFQPVFSASLNMGTITPASGAALGHDTFSIQQGGFALGASLAGGFGNGITVPASGLYALQLTANLQSTNAFSLAIAVNGAAHPVAISVNGASSPRRSFHACGLLDLAAGDTLSMIVTGSTTILTGSGNFGLAGYLL